MKLIRSLLILLLATMASAINAQSVDEIVDAYFENTGGKGNWSQLKGIKMNAKLNQGGLEIPLEIVQLADGRTYTKITFQGNVIMQGVFDGETLWNTNFQTMQAEKADAEQTANMKLQTNDFPDSFFNYKNKGYTAELVGTETFDGAETFKVKLVKEPLSIDGQEVEDITYYYFDSEAMVPIAQESDVKQGPQKGSIQQIKISDYQEVEGLYFPFAMTQGVKGGPSQPLMIESIEINPTVDESLFAFPGGQ